MIFFDRTNNFKSFDFNCVMTETYHPPDGQTIYNVVGYDDSGEVILASADCRSEILKIFEAFKSR